MFPKPPTKTQQEKRKEQLRLYSRKRRFFLNQKRYCEAKVACNPHFPDVANQIHHLRGRDGKRLLAEDEWLAICPKCHDWIHAHPAEARAKGLLLPRNQAGN